MPVEDFIISTFIFTDDFLKDLGRIRKSGPSPHLTDAEIITMEIVGEFLALGKGDKTIFDYFHQHWQDWFPKLNCRATFAKQCANLWKVKELLYHQIITTCLKLTQSERVQPPINVLALINHPI
jgi:hypothetical protein